MKTGFTGKRYFEWLGRESDLKCHCFVRDGRIEYLSDSTHEFRGKSVDMPAWPFSGEIA